MALRMAKKLDGTYSVFNANASRKKEKERPLTAYKWQNSKHK